MDTWISAFLGGILIALSIITAYWKLNKLAGISGILRTALLYTEGHRYWGYSFIIGLALTPGFLYAIGWITAPHLNSQPVWLAIIAGACVGLGSYMANGCTSGHALCGVARLKQRSLVATTLFIIGGFVAVNFLLKWIG